MIHRQLTCGSLFDGIGCFSLAFVRAGFRLAWSVEIDPQCQRVTRERFPGVTQYEDVRHAGRHNLEPVDLVLGGFPCQDLSVAGRRAGLAGERSSLWSEFRRVLGEIAPRWFLIENVPGLLSSNKGRDVGALLWQLGQLGYWWAYRVLDAQYDGLAQRRKRVFIVGRLGDEGVQDARRIRGLPCQILFDSESLSGNPPPRREKKEDVAGTPGSSPKGLDRAGAFVAGVTYQANGSGSFRAGAPSLAASDDSGSNHVVVSGQCHGGNVGEIGALRRSNSSVPFVAAFNIVGLAQEGKNHAYETDVSGCLQGKGLNPSGNEAGTVIAFHATQDPISGDVAPALSKGNEQGCGTIAVADSTTVRRLMPVECLRLQGLPDDWLDLDPPLSDSAKYRMIGNGGSVPTVSWIAERIKAAEEGRLSCPCD